MRSILGLAVILTGAILIDQRADGQSPPMIDHIGTAYAIDRDVESTRRGSDSSTGSSTDRDTLIERVRDIRPDGLILEYDLPSTATAQARASTWLYPFTIFRPNDGPLRLVNEAELQERIAAWLKQMKWDRGLCGRTISTWNAFKIECEPKAALVVAANYDLRPNNLRDGAAYRDPDAGEATIWRRTAPATGNIRFTATMPVDPERIRRDRVASDILIAELMRKSLTPADAAQARSGEQIAGTITIAYEVDPRGPVIRRLRIAQTHIVTTAGVVEDRVVTETVTRSRVSD